MQEDIDISSSEEKITSTIATFRNFSPEKPVSNAVIYFWESHTNNPDDKEKHQATIELIYKEFDMHTCEKYEVRTGYLNRYNFLSKPMSESSPEEIEEAVVKGEQEQNDWVNRCKPELPGFKVKNWQECVFKNENSRFGDCKKLIIKKQENKEFADAFSRTVNDYAEKHGTSTINGNAYVLEELSWILSLPLSHLNKSIYLIHVGIDGLAIRALFHHFPNLQKTVKWLSPKFTTTVFENESDFLMDYRSSNHVGYSYAMENKDVVKSITTFKKENDFAKEELTLALSREINEKNMLYSIIEKLPGHVYWLNRDNVYLGCNDLQAENYGLKSRHDIIGKTNREFYPIKDADVLDKNNITVMETGTSYEGEEPVYMQEKYGSYLSKKSPMFDTHGKVTGLLGISMDITDRKRVEELEKESEVQERIKALLKQVLHDVTTPLAILTATLDDCKNLSEKEYITLRNAVTSIKTITSHLLFNGDDKDEIEELADPIERYVSVPYSLEDRINSKRYEYKDSNVTFNLIKGSEDPFIFIRGDFSNYFRMMSNLINNAVEATESKVGAVVDVGFNLLERQVDSDNQQVEIYVQDYGKGMPKETVDKILSGASVGTTKEAGHGIGLQQIKKTLEQMNGKMLIDSKEGEGTRITLVFQRSESPPWFAEKIVLPKGGLVVVLDDDIVIHDYWKSRLEPHKNDISVRCFTHGDEAIDFINSSQEKHNIFLLADYELRNQSTNGIEVIEKCGLQNRSVLVTSCYISKIKDFPKKAEEYLKLLSKPIMDVAPVIVEEILFDDESVASDSGSFNVIVLDDSKSFADMVGDQLRSKGILADSYCHPNKLLKNLSKYSANTKIIMDNDFKCGISGEDLANQLIERGFQSICVLTGNPDNSLFLRYPKNTKFVKKGEKNWIDDIFRYVRKKAC